MRGSVSFRACGGLPRGFAVLSDRRLTNTLHPMIPGEPTVNEARSLVNRIRTKQRKRGESSRDGLLQNFVEMGSPQWMGSLNNRSCLTSSRAGRALTVASVTCEPRSSVNQNWQQVETAADWISCSLTGLMRPFRGVRGSVSFRLYGGLPRGVAVLGDRRPPRQCLAAWHTRAKGYSAQAVKPDVCRCAEN